jgi:hypothetical protein
MNELDYALCWIIGGILFFIMMMTLIVYPRAAAQSQTRECINAYGSYTTNKDGTINCTLTATK